MMKIMLSILVVMSTVLILALGFARTPDNTLVWKREDPLVNPLVQRVQDLELKLDSLAQRVDSLEVLAKKAQDILDGEPVPWWERPQGELIFDSIPCIKLYMGQKYD